MPNMTHLTFPMTGPGPLWEAWPAEVLAAGSWHRFDVHSVSIDESGYLVLRRGEQLPPEQVRLVALAVFPPHGWHGLKILGAGDARPPEQLGFKVPPPGSPELR